MPRLLRSRRPHGTSLAARRVALLTALLGAVAAGGAPARAHAQAHAPAHAPVPGRIAGRVIDAAQGGPIAGAQLEVVGTGVTALTALDGRYTLAPVAGGDVQVRVRMIGYQPKLVTGIVVAAGAAAEQDVALERQVVQLQEVTVAAAAERGSVARALDEQRTAVGVVSAVSAAEIARSPDGDAGQAVQRVSGVTVQDGRYVVVRGLGERYTTASLNGARIPSPEPERKVVPLDLFPSSLLEAITTAKTFTPDLAGDFSGGAVNLKTREFPARAQVRLSLATGLNSAAARPSVPAAPTTGGEWAALTGHARDLPAAVAQAGRFEAPLSQAEVNGMVAAFRPVWTPQRRTVRPNTSLGLSAGGSAALLGRRIGYLASATYGAGQEVQTGQVRGQAIAGGNGEAVAADRFVGSTGRESVLWGGLLNLGTTVGAHSRLSLNATYNRSADNEARRETGFSENLGGEFRIDRLRYVERAVRSSQLAGEHALGDAHHVDWSLTLSGVHRREPDRSEFVSALETDPATGAQTARWFGGGNEGAVRTFADLREHAVEGAANYIVTLGRAAAAPALKLGALLRDTRRTSLTRAYGLSAPTLPAEARALPPEQLFDGRYTGAGASWFQIAPLAQGGSYEAADRLYAGYAMTDVGLLAGRLRLIAGARLEHSRVRVVAEPTLGAPVTTTPTYTDVLPSATLNYSLSDRQTLRFAVSQTLARPEYRELAPVQYREVLGGDNVVGNAGLRRTRIRNADLRWELYPAAGEVVSLAVFAKHFDAPIERVYLATSGTRVVKYVNAASARNVGVEAEVRKRLDVVSPALRGLTAFANMTLMRSDVTIGTSEASRTNDERAMVGQAPYVLNGGLTYDAAGGLSATVLYNRAGRRIVSAAEAPLPDVYEEPRDVVDVSLRFPVAGGLSGRLDAKNLLDGAYRVMQGPVVRESYRTGRSLALGFAWGR
ncbi:MAG TPA: TonB-dependent receptor [Gemmatimonadales bacterium]|nr:TonB-dependent receptor [Gemmatimonadales bacterium]